MWGRWGKVGERATDGLSNKPLHRAGRLTGRTLGPRTPTFWKRLRARVDYTTRALQYLESINNPGEYIVARVSGLSRVIRFDNGFEMPMTRSNRLLIENLAALAYHGAEFSSNPDGLAGYWRVDYRNATLTTPTGIRFTFESVDRTIFAETFLYDIHYAGGDLTGAAVVDVGANVGDTALYYANQGAEVFAYEPDPENFRLMMQNLDLNPLLKPRIHAFPCAVGGDGVTSFASALRGSSGHFADGGQRLQVQSVSLRTILEANHIVRPYLLKSDSKGSEFQLVRQAELARFRRLAIEYDTRLGNGNLDELLAAVRRAGFGALRIRKHNFLPTPPREQGLLEAERETGPVRSTVADPTDPTSRERSWI